MLRGFPRRRIRPRTALYRIHRRDRSGWWFSRDGTGRFDLTGVPGRGTCYLAEDPLGSFIEVFRDTALVSESDVEARCLTVIRRRNTLTLADCTARRARAFGVTAAIHASENYALTQAWAAAFARGGFDGIRYFLSHDPAQRLVGVALFGPEGAPGRPRGRSRAIGEELVERAERLFGIRVVPEPG